MSLTSSPTQVTRNMLEQKGLSLAGEMILRLKDYMTAKRERSISSLITIGKRKTSISKEWYVIFTFVEM